MEPEGEKQIRKHNRRIAEEADRGRPIVHGVLPYLGHRPKAKDERRRLAQIAHEARKRVR
jgi:hypothetical protein